MARHDPKAMARSVVYYTVGAVSHRMRMHWAPGTDAALAATNAATVVNTIKTILSSAYSFSGHDYIPAGTNIGNPTAWTSIAGTGVANAGALGANQVSFVGRTAGGTRIRLFMYSNVIIADANYRVTNAESPTVAAITNWLNTTSNPMVALDGLGAVWKAYANVAQNDYWVKRLRRG